MATIEYLGTDKPVNHIQPKVSICITAYQHAEYIRQCLDGALAQKTSFPHEILLGEDDSSDGTRDICIAYAERHPDKIRLFLHDRKDNHTMGGRPTGKNNFLHNLKASRGEFLAFCDGDDFWISKEKIQRQVAALEQNPRSALCFHPSRYVDERDGTAGNLRQFGDEPRLIPAENIIKGARVLMNTIVIRSSVSQTLIAHCYEVADMHHFIRCLGAVSSESGVVYLPEPMGCYRKHSKNSIMDKLFNSPSGRVAWSSRTLTMLDLVDQYSNKKFHAAITYAKIRSIMDACASGNVSYAECKHLIDKFGTRFPMEAAVFFLAGTALRRARRCLSRYRYAESFLSISRRKQRANDMEENS